MSDIEWTAHCEDGCVDVFREVADSGTTSIQTLATIAVEALPALAALPAVQRLVLEQMGLAPATVAKAEDDAGAPMWLSCPSQAFGTEVIYVPATP